MRPKDRALATRLKAALTRFDRNRMALPGIANLGARDCFVEQVIESCHRVSYPSKLAARPISGRRADPNDELFDPIRAAILFQRSGQIEEAYWMVFLFVLFGRHPKSGWRYARQLYGRLGSGGSWDWASVSANPQAFSNWFDANVGLFDTTGSHGFGNHRKYESLRETSAVVKSYVAWVGPPRTHQELMAEALHDCANDPRRAFDEIYRTMTVFRFGRTAKFDYLTMLGKLSLSPIQPGSTYMSGATGPLDGARLLLGRNDRPTDLDKEVKQLGSSLKVGMQVMEDALCNWQKSPNDFRPFR